MSRVERGRRAARRIGAALLVLSSGSAAPAAGRQSGEPAATLLYQNFPNPFPTATSRATCVWFDLATAGDVRLDLFTLRGVHVRSLVPSRDLPGRLAAGRYGRGISGGSGCDARLAWDGTGDDGRQVPAGVYLIRLRAGGADSFRKALFQGR